MLDVSTISADHQRSIALDQPKTRRAAAAAGARAITPLAVGLLPLALTIGTTAAHAGLPPLVGWISSASLYGASGQLTWIQMLATSAPSALVVGTTLMVNLQLLMYGSTMRTYWAGESRRWRGAAAHLLVSPVFAVATAHHEREPDPAVRKTFYMAAGCTLWSAWLVATGIGYACGGLPSLPVLTVLTPLVMVSLALRSVRDVATMAALLVGAVVAVLGNDAPYDLGFVGAGVAGAIAGVVVDAGFVTVGVSRRRDGNDRLDHTRCGQHPDPRPPGRSGAHLRANDDAEDAAASATIHHRSAHGSPRQPQRRPPGHHLGRAGGPGSGGHSHPDRTPNSFDAVDDDERRVDVLAGDDVGSLAAPCPAHRSAPRRSLSVLPGPSGRRDALKRIVSAANVFRSQLMGETVGGTVDAAGGAMREFAERRLARPASERGPSHGLGLREERGSGGMRVQARLVVGRSDDPFEREADLIADRVVAAVLARRVPVVDDRGSVGVPSRLRRRSVVGTGGGADARDQGVADSAR